MRLGAASVFVEFDRVKNELSIAANNTAELTGKYPISIELIDEFKNNNTYSFNLNVTCAKDMI